jgi:hypothetical protein
MPTTQYLRSASVVNGAPRSTSTARRPYSRPDSFGYTPLPLWERACSRRRPDSRPISPGCTSSPCGSEPARDGGLTAALSPRLYFIPLWERACSRWRPDSRPTSVGMVGQPGRIFRRSLAVAGWEGLSLTFPGRCNQRPGLETRPVNGVTETNMERQHV